MDEPEVGDAQSSTIAVPVVAAVLEDILPYLGLEPEYTKEQLEEIEEGEVVVPKLVGEKPHEAQIQLRNRGLNTEIIGKGPEIVKQIPEDKSKLPIGGTVILYTDESEANTTATVPNVIGKSASEANKLIVNAGLNIKIVGSDLEGAQTVVVSQDPLPNTTVDIGSVVTVDFVQRTQEEQSETP